MVRWRRLPRGVHELGDTFFLVGEKMVHLRSQNAPDLPESTNGIATEVRADRIHIMHATQNATLPGTEIGTHVVRYDDGTSERIPISYGREVAVWLGSQKRELEKPTNARTAWLGENGMTDRNPKLKVYLFSMTWINPHPGRTIATIDAITKPSNCGLFLVAITLERDPPRSRTLP